MLTFNQFIKEEYIDWDYVLNESSDDDINFVERRQNSRYSYYRHEKTFPHKNGSLELKLIIDRSHTPELNEYQHNIEFSINGKTSRGEVGSKDEAKTRKDVIEHIGRAVRSYVDKYAKEKGKHIITGIASDEDQRAEKVKSAAYGRFGKALAKRIGGKVHHDDLGMFISKENK